MTIEQWGYLLLGMIFGSICMWIVDHMPEDDKGTEK